MKKVSALKAFFVWILGMLSLAIILPVSFGADVCTVVSFPGNRAESRCFTVPENSNGIEVLQKAGLRLLLTSPSQFGRMVCKIDDIGTDISGSFCAFSGEFWNFALRDGQSWRHMPVGFDAGDACWNRDFSFSDFSQIVHYCARAGDVLGLAFGKEGAAPEMLNLKEVRVFVDGEPDNDSFIQGGAIDEGVGPGADILMKFTLQNLYSQNTGIRINSVIVRGELNDIAQGDDIRLKLDEFILDPEEKETVELRFTVPIVVEAKDYTLDVKIRGVDEFGIAYDKLVQYIVDVGKEQNKVRIDSAALDSEAYTCEDAAFLNVSLVNIGSRNADGMLSIANGPLGLNISDPFSLTNDAFEASSRLQKLLTIPLRNIIEGSYPVDVRARLKIGKTAIKNLVLQKKGCIQKKNPMEGFQEKEIAQKAQVNANKQPMQQQPVTSAKQRTSESSSTAAALFIGSSLGLAAFILVVGLWFALKMMKKR